VKGKAGLWFSDCDGNYSLARKFGVVFTFDELTPGLVQFPVAP
jgi:hypothetical protein